jgi:hypothetical protein
MRHGVRRRREDGVDRRELLGVQRRLPRHAELAARRRFALQAGAIGLEIGHIDGGDAGGRRGGHDPGAREQQVLPGAFGAEVGRQVPAAQEQPADAFVRLRHMMGGEDRPCEFHHRDDPDRGLRAVQDVGHEPDLVGGFALGNDDGVGAGAGFMEREQVAETVD